MRFLGRLFLGVLAIVGFLTLGVVGLVWWGVSSIDLQEAMHRTERPDSFVLAVDLRRPFPEGEPATPLAMLEGAAPSLAATVRAIDHAATDPAVTALWAEVGGSGAGLAQAQDLRAAVQRFRASGKPAWVYAETLNEGDAVVDTYLASAFDQVLLQPSGGVGPLGFAAEVPFLRGLLDDIGVAPAFDAREDHKNAFDSVTRHDMSEAQRESLNDLLNGFWTQVRDDIAQARGMTPAAVQAAAAQSPLLPPDALESGLVDRLVYRDEAEDGLFAQAGVGEAMTLEDYAADLFGSGPADDDERPQIALIHASGEVLRGAASESVFGNETAIYSETLSATIDEAVNDTNTRAILIRLDSPGGSYVASDTVWAKIRAARDAGMPVVVSMGNVAASGGYFIAMAADHVVAEPGTITGSIGVISGKLVLQEMWNKLNVQWDDVAVGGPALMYSANQPFTPEQWQRFQRELDWIYDDFIAKVALSRDLTEEQVRAIAGGRIWTGTAAAQRGLVDELGGLDAALAEAKRRANIDADTAVALVNFPRARSPMEQLLEALDATPLATAGTDARTLAALGRIARVLEPVAEHLEAAQAGASGTVRAQLPAHTGDGR